VLPTFLIIGAMKAGTTSLWHYLDLHPQIQVSDTKEINFFVAEKNWSRGWEWYESLFVKNQKDIRALGEASTSYTKKPEFQGIPQRIVTRLPEVKLIYIVRDPIERIRSMYVHMVYAGYEQRPFESAVTDPEINYYVDFSRYFYQLSQYLDYFLLDQILVIASEDLYSFRQETLKRVFRFLKVAEEYDNQHFNMLRNLSEKKRQLNTVGSALKAISFNEKILRRMPSWLRSVYLSVTTVHVPKPQISDDVQDWLVKRLRPDAHKLCKVLGCDFPQWNL